MLRPQNYPDIVINEKVKILGPTERTGMLSWELKWVIFKILGTRGNILEIGTHYGDTAKELSLQFPDRKIICVDMCHPDYPEINQQTVCRSARNQPNVELRLMDSKRFVYDPKDDISVIIIDGDHSWEGVKADTELALAYLKGRHGTIIWHDCYPACQVWSYLNWLYDHNLLVYYVNSTCLAFYDC